MHKIMKKAIWVGMTAACVVTNFFILWALFQVPFNTDFKSLSATIVVLNLVITSVMNAMLVPYWYEKAEYNQEFVDIVQKELKNIKNE